MRKIWMASALALSVGLGTLGALPAQASSKGRRNTAIGLGAAAVYELLQGKTTAGLALGAGAAYGYKRYKDAKDDERYDRGYGYRGRDRRYSSDRDYRPERHDEYRRSSYDYVRDSRDRYAREDREPCRDR